MTIIQFIFRHLDQFRLRFVVVFLAGLSDGAVVFLFPVLLSEFTRSDFTANKVLSLIYWLILVYVASLFFQWILRRHGESLAVQFGNHLRLKYFSALADLSMDKLSGSHSGYVLSLVNKISDGLGTTVHEVVWTIARGISGILLFFYFTSRESVAVAWVNLALLSVFVATSVLLSKKMVPIASELNVRRARLLESYADFLSNILTVKRLGVGGFAKNILSEKTDNNFTQIRKLQNFHANRWFFLHTLYGLALFFTISFLLWQIAQGKVSASILILFVAAYMMIKGLIEKLSEDVKMLMEMRAYLENLEAIVSLNEKTMDSFKQSPMSWENIIFQDVHFQYSETGKYVDIPRFKLKNGEKICLSGMSGEGKTTFLNLLAGFLVSQQGNRFIDSIEYASLSARFFQERMILISQEAELFNISLRDNVTLGRITDDSELERLFEAFDLLDWVLSLPDSFETVVGEKGVKLSAGQRQRINLLRGVLSDREILLLDEPTSHLDAETERRVVEFLKTELKGKTVVIVSHREALFDLCDTLYTIENHILVKK